MPQDPTLFAGTLRSNVDPFGDHGDADVAAALGRARCSFAEAGGLDAPVEEGGANLSAGERQLLCFARVLLKTSACVVLLDEATSSIDAGTDRRLAAVVEDQLRGRATMVVIAHRIATIRAADLVLVLAGGKNVEFGPPADLAQADGPYARLLAGSPAAA